MATSRKDAIAKIEALTESKLICYLTGDRAGQGVQIGDDAIPPLYDHLQRLGKSARIALLLYSRGGSTLAGFAMANALREFADEVIVLVPFRAHSCATLISLSANSIVMGPFAQLSPIDPSITTPHGPSMQVNGQTQFIPVSVEDVANFFALARNEAKVAEDRMVEIFGHLCAKVNPLALGGVYRAREQIGMLARKLLRRHLTDETATTKIVTTLTRELLSHDYIIGRTEALEIGLPVETPSPELADAMWALFASAALEMKLSEQWIPERELRGQQMAKGVNCLAVLESAALQHHFTMSYEIRRTTVKDASGAKVEAVETKAFANGWTVV